MNDWVVISFTLNEWQGDRLVYLNHKLQKNLSLLKSKKMLAHIFDGSFYRRINNQFAYLTQDVLSKSGDNLNSYVAFNNFFEISIGRIWREKQVMGGPFRLIGYVKKPFATNWDLRYPR